MSKKHKKKANEQPKHAVQSVSKRQANTPGQQPASAVSSASFNTPAAVSPSLAGGEIRSIEQQRASFALARLEQALAQPEAGKYRHSQLKSFLRRLPAMIQMNGFGQALAFYYAKRTSYEAYGVVYKLLEDWLCAEGQVYANADVTPGLMPEQPHLLYAVTSLSQQEYRLAEAEAQALLGWAKKFAEALVLKPETQEED